MTIGDVLAVIAGVATLCLSVWALVLGTALLFGLRAERARSLLGAAPGRALGIGVAVTTTAGLVSLLLLSQPRGPLKLFGWILLMGLLTVSALGASGLALLVAGRIRRLEPRLSEFDALARGAGLLVVAGLVPLLGWFVCVPAMVLASLGAGWQVLFGHRTALPHPVTATSGEAATVRHETLGPPAAAGEALRDW